VRLRENLCKPLQSCEGFSGVKDDLKAKERLLEKEQQHKIPCL
jgi:hypothetical protein